MDNTKEINIDIGSGDGKFFKQLAEKEPDGHFMVMDPTVQSLTDKPANLHLVKWSSEKNWHLPIQNSIVDNAHLNFLLGEIIGVNPPSDLASYYSEGAYLARYQAIVQDLKRVLKHNATVHVIEPRGNVYMIKDLFLKEGFRIDEDPKRLMDEEKTTWAKAFFTVFRKSGKREEKSVSLPMEFEATWIG